MLISWTRSSTGAETNGWRNKVCHIRITISAHYRNTSCPYKLYTEKEAFAFTWACEHHSDYLVEFKFHTQTDYKPLVPLFSKGGLHMKPPKFEHIFVAVITFFPFFCANTFDTTLLLIVCALRCYVKSLYRHLFLEYISKHARVTQEITLPNLWQK